MQRWDLAKPETWAYYPSDALFHNPLWLNRLRVGFTKQIRERLQLLRNREEKLTGPATGFDIEQQLRRLARLGGSRRRDMHVGIRAVIDKTFTRKSRKVLYRLLVEIEESIPWRGIDWYQIHLDDS